MFKTMRKLEGLHEVLGGDVRPKVTQYDLKDFKNLY